MKLALILRGHERDTFLNSRLYDFIKRFSSDFPVDIFIHTWSSSIGEICWRPLSIIARPITETTLQEYFKDIPIKHVIIDDEQKIELFGPTDGNVSMGPCPRIAWKRMWYGKHKIIEHIMNSGVVYDFLMNIRFDVFQNSNNIFTEDAIIERTKDLVKMEVVNHIYFMKENPCAGIDNCYFGSIPAIYKLCHSFHLSLSAIETEYKTVFYTEFLVFFKALDINYKTWFFLMRATPNITRLKIK